jgi:hypothetical protein
LPRTSASTANDAAADDDAASADARIDCPAAQPRMGTPCDWPAAAACQYHDKCPPACGFPGADLVRCVNGQFEYQVCSYSLGCPDQPPEAQQSCLCAPGYYGHSYLEAVPCTYRCADGNGTYVVTCTAGDLPVFAVTAPASCVPLATSSAGAASDASDGATD